MSRAASRTLAAPLILFAIAGWAAAVWTTALPGDPRLFPARGEAVEVLLLDNGFHTDLAVPRARLEARGGPLAEAVRALPPGDWILIGWGDARFYVDQSPIGQRLPDGARAFFRPGNASVVMIDPVQDDPRVLVPPPDRRTLPLSPEGFERLAAHVEASLALEDGRATVAAARTGDDARFLASRETFSILHLCNHWSAATLNAAGVPVRPFRAITSAEVMAAVDRAQLDTTARGD